MPQPKILVVDDTPAKLIRNRILLRKLDCDVIEASSGEEAMAAFQQHEFAVIVLDVQMPGMDGFEVAQRMSSLPQGRDVPIIFSTATVLDDTSRIKAYGTGAVDYIIEPSDPTILQSKARVFLELYRTKQELRWLLSERTRLEELARHEAHHDGMTGLPNRRLFMDRLALALERAKRSSSMFAVLYLDMDDFKPVNDRYGHPVGDELLKAFGQRLQAQVRKLDTVARFGGDEFAAILDEPIDVSQTMSRVEEIARGLRMPYVVQPQIGLELLQLSVGVSIGVSIYPEDGTDIEMLIQKADKALYLAKHQGKNRCLHGGD